MALGLYRVSVLALAGLQFPRPTSEDHEFIHNAYQSGWTVKKTVRRLKEKVKPAAAPTPVEPEEISEDDYYDGEPCPECGRPCLECDCPAAPAESQGVERAQPVEGPQEPLYRLKACDKCGKEFTYDYECHCGFGWHYVSAPVERVERVTDDAPARVEPTKHEPVEGSCPVCLKPFHVTCANCGYSRAAQPAKHTDDRPAETIPERYTQDFKDASGWHNGSYIQQIHRELGRAETRIEVLEAALRKVSRYHHDTCDQMLSPGAGYACSCGKSEADAALAAPSGEQP